MPTFPETDQPQSSPWVKIIHYLVVGFIVAGGALYWVLKPPILNPMSDPTAAEAMALVQTHRAQHAPTLRQAMTDRVKTLIARGQKARLGEWTVERQQENIYVVRIWIREEITKGWFEREYIWQVNVERKKVIPMTVAAADLMPIETEEGTTSTPGPTTYFQRNYFSEIETRIILS